MTKRYRLTMRAQMGGAIQEPGFEFTLEDGEVGPMRSVVASNHGANHLGQPGGLVDIPLYVEVKDEPAPEPVSEEAVEELPTEEPVIEGDEKPADPISE